MLLSGEGGDEAFAGYPRYRNLLFIRGTQVRVWIETNLAISGTWGLWEGSGKDIRHYKNFVHSSIADYYYGLSATPETPFNRQKKWLYRHTFAASLGDRASDTPTRNLFEQVNGKSLLQKLLYVDTKSWLPDDLLIKADKMTMATSVELRVPLLDHQILEFAASLPSSFKVRGLATKRILKLALLDSVPGKIFRTKAGFPLPYDRWLKGELRDFVNDTLLSPNAAIDAYFEKNELKRLLQVQQGSQSCGRNSANRQHALDYSREVFSLLVLEIWHKEFRL